MAELVVEVSHEDGPLPCNISFKRYAASILYSFSSIDRYCSTRSCDNAGRRLKQESLLTKVFDSPRRDENIMQRRTTSPSQSQMEMNVNQEPKEHRKKVKRGEAFSHNQRCQGQGPGSMDGGRG